METSGTVIGMKRRSFFSVPALAAAGVALAPDEARASGVVRRTAVSIRMAMQYDLEPTSTDVVMPEGFHPCAISINTDAWLGVRLYDNDGDIVNLHDQAFLHGPVDFWREPTGPMRVEIWCDGCPSVPPLATIVIYGEIDP